MRCRIYAVASLVLVLFSRAVCARYAAIPEARNVSGTCIIAADKFQAVHDAAMAQNPSGVSLHLKLAGDQTEFQVGERIPIVLEIKSTTPGYKAEVDGLDRCGIYARDVVNIQQRPGAADPSPAYYAYEYRQPININGRGPDIEPVTASGVSIGGDLNPWVRFTSPGTYSLYITNARIFKASASHDPFGFLFRSGLATPLAASDILTVRILPDDPAWTEATVSRAKLQLNTPSAPIGEEALRYLGTPEAVNVLVDNLSHFKLWDDYNSGEFYISRLAILEAQDKPAALSDIQRCMADPHFPVRDSVLQTAALLSYIIDGGLGAKTQFGRAEPPAYDALLVQTSRDLYVKSGFPKAITLYTLLTDAEYAKARHDKGAVADCRRYSDALFANFNSLPPAEMDSVLDPGMGVWNDLKRQGMVPILKRLVLAPDTPDDLRSQAGARLLELAPASGHKIFLNDMTGPSPSLDLPTLSMLSDKELSGFDKMLIDRLNSGTRDPSLYTGLIARYGTPAILPDVKKYIEPSTGQPYETIDVPLLAYLFRVDPTYAVGKFKRRFTEVAHHGGYFSLFTDVGFYYSCEALRLLAVHALRSQNKSVECNAATFLRTCGDNDSVLRERLSQWNKTQKPSVFPTVPGNGFTIRSDDFGSVLVTSITGNPAVLYDRKRLLALRTLCITEGEKGSLDDALLQGADHKHVNYLASLGWGFGQYYGLTLNQVENLTSQCPQHTKLTIVCQELVSPQYTVQARQLQRYLTAHGIDARLDGANPMNLSCR